MSYIEDVSALAHNNTKAAEDPDWNGCILSYREKAVTHAQAVERSGLAGNDNPSDFEKEVVKLLKDPEGTAAAISKGKVDAAQANADAAVERAKAVAAGAVADAKVAKADAAAQKKTDDADAAEAKKAEAKK